MVLTVGKPLPVDVCASQRFTTALPDVIVSRVYFVWYIPGILWSTRVSNVVVLVILPQSSWVPNLVVLVVLAYVPRYIRVRTLGYPGSKPVSVILG